MNQPTIQASQAPATQITRSPRQRPVNYRFLHRGAILIRTPLGIARVEMFQKRAFEHLSLQN